MIDGRRDGPASGKNSGAEMYRAGVKRRFSAAHRLEGHPGKCASLHGHTWMVEAIFTAQELDGLGMTIDFDRAAELLEQAIAPYDHTYLNELVRFADLNPTAENVARAIFEDITGDLATRYPGVSLETVTVWESPDSWASYVRD